VSPVVSKSEHIDYCCSIHICIPNVGLHLYFASLSMLYRGGESLWNFLLGFASISQVFLTRAGGFGPLDPPASAALLTGRASASYKIQERNTFVG